MPGKALFTPLQIGNTVLKNRIVMSALTRNRAEDTYPTELMKEYYVQRASAGLIITEGILVSRQGAEWSHAPGMWDDKHVAGWKNIVDAVHAAGGKIYAQLWHLGRLAHPDAPQQILAGVPVYGPSAISARGGKFPQLSGAPGYVTPTEIDDPWIFIQQFKDAAIKAKFAGFDGAELHACGGYLVAQFLDSTSNKRTDQWGGNVQNRARFGLEVLKVLIEAFGRDVALEVHPSGGFNDMGMPLQETLATFSYFLSEADKLNIAFVELVRYSPRLDVEFDGVWRATKHDVVEAYRPYIKNAKLFVNADVTPEEGEALVSAGKVDAVTFGWNYIAHPDVVERVLHDKPFDNVVDIAHLYTRGASTGSDWSVGYTDYPRASY